MRYAHVVPGVGIMVGRWKRHAVWIGVTCMVACMASMLPTSSAHAVTPTQPSFNDPFVWVSDVGEVSAQWDASVDTSGHAINYTLYRDVKPITAISIGVSPTLQVVIDNYTGTSYTAAAAAQEIAQSYVWYYAVRARATVTTGVFEYSLPSKSAAPNMHGYPADSKNTVTCDRCHNVHGAYGDVDYREVGLCYSCHAGATSALPGLRSSINVKADFFEYADQTAGSQHVMSNDARRCSACHSPHRSPWYYDIAGVYQPTNSFRDMLRIQTGVNASGKPTYTYTSRNDDTAENITSCMLCHGASSTNIAYVGGASAYGDTAGDHNSAGYATAAHGPAVILGNESDTSQPQIQCLACHDNHASSLDKLIAYRKDSSGLSDAVDLCYSCHSQSSGETRVVGSNAPFSWNGRDVQAQFAKHSRHPTSVPVGGNVPVSASWSQTTLADFTADTRNHVSVVAGGSGTSGAMQLESIYNTGITFLTEGFEDATWTTDFPTSSGEWATSTTWSPGGSYSLRATGGNVNPDVRTSRVLNLAGTSNVIVSFRWQRVGLDAGEYMRIQYSTNGSTWTEGWSTQGNGNTVNDGGAPATFAIASPTATTYIRLVLDNVSSTSEYGYWDDIIVTGDQFAGYENVGTAVSTAVPTGAGTVTTWGNLTYSASQPSGSQLAVDVLDGTSGSVLLSGVSSGTSLSALSASSLKLRARLTGDAALPSVVSDTFNDNSFDTAKWTDAFLNGSTDPDAGAPIPWSSVAEPFATLSNWTVANSADSRWVSQAAAGNPAPCAELQFTTGGSTNRATAYMTRIYDLSTPSNLSATFNWLQNGTSGGDFFEIWASDDGATWTQIWTEADAVPTTWQSVTTAATIPTGPAVYIQFRGAVRSSGRYFRLDNFQINGSTPGTPTTIWPKETGSQLQLRAEGAAFGGTADEGEFTYIAPTQGSWIRTEDFDLKVNVAAGGSGAAKAGLMIRTASSEANALLPSSAMAGVYLNGTNALFQYRAAGGGTTTSAGTTPATAAEWLMLQRRGNVITALCSENENGPWTTIGSGTVTGLNTNAVLVGLALTSGVNGTYTEATWDTFSVTSAVVGAATVTPRLDEWAVAYEWLPAPTSGQLVCMSCHNVHSVGKGTGSVWNMARVSDPDNTKLAFSGSPTQFCLRCHDGGAPSAASTATKLVPYDVGLSAVASPLFPGWNKNAADVQFTSGAHSATTIAQLAGEFGCETCHDPHASDNDRLTALTAVGSGGASNGHLNVRRDNSTTYAEQNLCYACHAPGRAGSCTGCHGVSMGNLEARTAFQATYRHPVETTGRHSDTETAADLGPSNRHAECADCHDPHAAKAGLHVAGSSKPGEVLRGAFGVKPTGAWPANWTAVPAAGWTAERMTGETTDYEAYVCFKCHSSYSGQPFTAQSGGVNYTSSDVAREFNPSNASYHNVLGQSVGMKTSFEVQLLDGSTQNVTWALPATLDIFKAGTGLDRDSMLTCTSCHINSSTTTTQAKGPHGSSVKWLLDSAYPTEWKTTSLGTGTLGMSNSTNICAKCHDLDGASGNWSNGAHADSEHRGTYGQCNMCHTAIPHGWKRPRLLGYTTDGIYATASQGTTGVRVGNHTASGSSVSWSLGDCAAACSQHSSSFGNSVLWP